MELPNTYASRSFEILVRVVLIGVQRIDRRFRWRFTGAAVGSGDPAAAQRGETQIQVRESAQADRIRANALRNDDGRHTVAALQAAHRSAGRPNHAARQEGRPRRHPRVHPLPTAPPQGTPSLIATDSRR